MSAWDRIRRWFASRRPTAANPRHFVYGAAAGGLLLVAAGSLAMWAPGRQGDDAAERFPLTSRDCPVAADAAAAAKFSVPSGFHDAPFELSLTSDADGPIYYTLDGSCPDMDRNGENTFVYERPIPVADRTGLAAKLATIKATVGDRTPYFAGRRGRFAMPDLDEVALEQATIVRARTAGGRVSTATYFVGPERVRDRLPVLSLVTDPDHLFGDERGIYVPGRLLDEWLDSDDYNPEARWGIPTNYNQRGRKWERPALLTFCLPGGDCIERRRIGLRMHGRFSRSFPQKSMRLYARKVYGDRRLRKSYFVDDPEVPKGHRRLILRNSGNDTANTMLADGFFQSIMRDLKADTQAYQPVVVFVNGEYWGIYNIRERYDRHYVALVHGANPDRIDLLNNSGSRLGLDSDLLAEWWRWLHDLADISPTSDAFAAEVEATIDVDNFFDFIIAHVFAGNRDWVSNNVRWWRERDGPHAAGEGARDGRWRWMISDFDQWGEGRRGNLEYDNFTDRLAPTDDLHYRHGFPFLFHRITANDGLRDRFLNRFADLLNTSFHPRVTVPKLEAAKARIAGEIQRHQERWQTGSLQDWRNRVARIADYLEERPDYQRRQLKDLFALDGLGNLTIVGDPRLGSVRVNSVEIAGEDFAEDGGWTGIYFQGVPVTVEAVPADGYRFVGWEGLENAAPSPDIEIAVGSEGVELRPHFALE